MENYSIEDLGVSAIRVYQQAGAYKFTSDAVLLAKFAQAKKGETVADFCSGSGIVGFYFYALNKSVSSVTFFELQENLSQMCAKSIELNKLTNFNAVCCRVQDIPNEYNGKFSLILCNPPYERAGSGAVNKNPDIALCRTELELTLDELLKSASKRLKFGGRICMVHRADRLAEVIYTMKRYKIEPKVLQLIESAPGKEAYLFLIQGVLGGKPGIQVLKNSANQNFAGEHN